MPMVIPHPALFVVLKTFTRCQWLSHFSCYCLIKGARYLLIIHELLVAMGFFPAGVQDETLKEESQRLAS